MTASPTVPPATTPAAARAEARNAQRRIDKFTDRRDQLALSALQTLSERGYARTSLREIAQNSEFSHGVLHYYFADKVELILYCVHLYKAECVHRYDEMVETSTTAPELAERFGIAMAATLHDEAHMHRLWYDMRSQSLFEESFRPDVLEMDRSLLQMIWRIVTRYHELDGRPVTVAPEVAYALFDGLFQQALLRHLSGDDAAVGDLRSTVSAVLVSLSGPALLPGGHR